MLYTPATKAALRLCFQAHQNQLDKAGVPYVFHPFHLAEQMQTEHEICVALLHDVMEDTSLGPDDLLSAGIPEAYVETCQLLTHASDVPYLSYVRMLSADPVARKVKLADLRHNADLTRLNGSPAAADLARREKYLAAIDLLEGADNPLEAVPISKFRACLLAGAVGDALGYPVEFMGLAQIQYQYGELGISAFAHTPAHFSDDTQMTLFTAAGLERYAELHGGSNEPPSESVRRAYLDWLSTQDETYTDNPGDAERLLAIPELHACRAPGNTCLSALYEGGTGSIDEPINNSKGCGGVMRVAPWGLFFRRTLKDDPTEDDMLTLAQEGAAMAALTHGHPLGWIPAAALCYIIDRCAYEVPEGCIGPGWELGRIVDDCAARLGSWFPSHARDARLMARLLRRAAALAQGTELDEFCIKQLGEGWVGEEALAIAVFAALRHASSLDTALAAAVNHDGDSDSTGAICGNILGALLGMSALGPEWDGVELRDEILAAADRLASV